jgi:hypothetical protein
MNGRREVGRVRYPGQTVTAISTVRDIIALLLTGLTVTHPPSHYTGGLAGSIQTGEELQPNQTNYITSANIRTGLPPQTSLYYLCFM